MQPIKLKNLLVIDCNDAESDCIGDRGRDTEGERAGDVTVAVANISTNIVDYMGEDNSMNLSNGTRENVEDTLSKELSEVQSRLERDLLAVRATNTSTNSSPSSVSA